MKVTLGGDRLGSGNKNKLALRNYERSTHNLSRKFTSSMQCGTLYPFLVMPAMRGDKFDINLAADARTIPTKGPLFGSFKMQVDLFQCDVRLYQAILHNNPLAIGLKMNQVLFPRLDIKDTKDTNAFSNSCLLKYLGMSGLGHSSANEQNEYATRYINAIPALAYYEIFKTYYSNKQEENAYIISTYEETGNAEDFTFYYQNNATGTWEEITSRIDANYPVKIKIDRHEQPTGYEQAVYVTYRKDTTLVGGMSLKDLLESTCYNSDLKCAVKIGIDEYIINGMPNFPSTLIANNFIVTASPVSSRYFAQTRGLEPFALANIDEMRLKLLSHHTLGEPFRVVDFNSNGASNLWGVSDGIDRSGLPYKNLVTIREDDKTKNTDPLNGLCVKTYQSDLFNNWVNTEWIDGENGISQVTAISTQSGSITIDSINFSEKLYNMLNRVAVSDGSYEGWQDAVYTETPKRHIESPIYLGGMSSEIVFEEIVQTSQGDTANPLGTLGGKGKILKRKGGHVTVKTNEAAFIIGIVSLTPRVNYTQGNEFYLTDILSMDDFHKPALDGIGFQNLIAERMAWWDTELENGLVTNRHTVGKVPAWIEYMTAVDKSYGDFAEEEGRGFMSLNREYDRNIRTNTIQDATTYIDPRKYNYAFAVSDIDAQNFWVQIYSEITARRLMSAKQIPNI